MGDDFCLRHFLSHDARRSCPECVLDEERRDRKRLIDVQEESRRDAQRRYDEAREEREAYRKQLEREQDPDYWERQVRRLAQERRDEEETKSQSKRVNRLLGSVLRCRFLTDRASVEAEREKKLQEQTSAGFLSKLFSRALPDKTSIRATPETRTMEFGKFYRYRFESIAELFCAYTIFIAQLSSPSDATAKAGKFLQYEWDETRDRSVLMRVTDYIEPEYNRLEESLSAGAQAAVAAYERSRDSCKQRNATCPGWELSGFRWGMSEKSGWHWTGEHAMVICGESHTFKTPYEYLAVFQARRARALAKNDTDQWTDTKIAAFQRDHYHWLGSHLIDWYKPSRIQ